MLLATPCMVPAMCDGSSEAGGNGTELAGKYQGRAGLRRGCVEVLFLLRGCCAPRGARHPMEAQSMIYLHDDQVSKSSCGR